jgi:hypothetical protein
MTEPRVSIHENGYLWWIPGAVCLKKLFLELPIKTSKTPSPCTHTTTRWSQYNGPAVLPESEIPRTPSLDATPSEIGSDTFTGSDFRLNGCGRSKTIVVTCLDTPNRPFGDGYVLSGHLGDCWNRLTSSEKHGACRWSATICGRTLP